MLSITAHSGATPALKGDTMQVRILVRYHSSNSGRGVLRATGSGCNEARRQATISYPHELSSSLKYYEAARELAFKLERDNDWNLRLIRRSSSDSCIAGEAWETFHYEVFDNSVKRFNNHDAVKYDRLPASN